MGCQNPAAVVHRLIRPGERLEHHICGRIEMHDRRQEQALRTSLGVLEAVEGED